jgi:HK97 family phage major capsid protein
MPYNNIISRSDASALIPEQVSDAILTSVAGTNPLMQLARELPRMSRAQVRLPVPSALASAYFVSGDTGLKQTTEANWTNKYIDAEELAVIVPISEAVLDDADYPIWEQVQEQLVTAFSLAVTQAVLFGTNIPATWTANLGAAGLLARCTAASHVVDLSTQVAAGQDVYDVLLGDAGVIALIEEDGYMATGHVAHLSMRGKLRGLREKVYNGTGVSNLGAPMFTNSMQESGQFLLDGQPIYFPTDGSMSSSVLLFTGQWDQLVYAMRQDMTFKLLTEAVIQDSGGNILYNLAQQDMVALRAVMRLGFALPNPINRVNSNSTTRCAFAALVP